MTLFERSAARLKADIESRWTEKERAELKRFIEAQWSWNQRKEGA